MVSSRLQLFSQAYCRATLLLSTMLMPMPASATIVTNKYQSKTDFAMSRPIVVID